MSRLEVQSVLELLPEPTLLVSPKGLLKGANRAFWGAVGSAPNSEAKGSLFDFCAGAEEQLREYLALCAGVRQFLPGSIRLRTAAAGTVKFRCEGACLEDGPPEKLLLIRLHRQQTAARQFLALNQEIDELQWQISERRRVEAALRKTEALFRQLADAMPQIVWAARPDGFIDYYNQRWYEWTGSRDVFGDDSWRPILHPDDRQRATETYYAAIRAGEPYQIEYRFRDRTNGGYRWFLGRALPVRDEHGQIIRWFGTCTDIDVLKRADETRARLAAIVESSQDAIVAKTLDGRITDWNRGAEQMFGFTAPEMIGKSIRLLIPEEYAGQEDEILASIRRGERIAHYETVRRHKDGTLIDVSLSVSPIFNNEGTIIGASKIARDITRQKRTERALAQAQEALRRYALELEKRVEERTAELQKTVDALDAFCHTIAHDLRAPLRALRGFSELLSAEYKGVLEGEGHKHLERIDTAAAHMEGLIFGLLQLGRLSTAELGTEALKMDEIVRRACVPLEPDFRAKDAALKIEEPLLPVRANAALLELVMASLLGNAVKFTRPGVAPEIRIWTDSRDGKVRVLVQDNGIGIEPEYLPNLFKPFLRLVKSDAYPGIGIGLAVARKAAERMGGQVGVESELGSGSTFWIELPPGEAVSSRREADGGCSASRPDGSDGPGAPQAEHVSPSI